MGKKVREKKLARLEVELAERAAIEERKRQRIAPTIRLVKRLTAAVAATVMLLYLGWVVNDHLALLVRRLTENSS